MSYVKTTWETGDIVTADKLNNIEGGVENNTIFYVDFSFDNQSVWSMTATVEQIQQKVADGIHVVGRQVYESYQYLYNLVYCGMEEDDYIVFQNIDTTDPDAGVSLNELYVNTSTGDIEAKFFELTVSE